MDPTWPARSPPPSETATNGCSTDPRSGPPERGGRTGGSVSLGPTGTCPSTGASVFILPIRQAGIEVRRIEMLNGSKEFCQEFLSEVRVPDTDRVGDVDDGWTVGTRWMFHERMLYNSPLVTHPVGTTLSLGAGSLVTLARDSGRIDDPCARELIGEARMLDIVGEHLQEWIGTGVSAGRMSDQAAAVARLFKGVAAARTRTIAFELSGASGAAWTDEDGAAAGCGVDFLMRQTSCIGGGTTEMARNVISERLLGMPRETTFDRDIPFRDVPRGPGSGSTPSQAPR